jgi:hypothetical protein
MEELLPFLEKNEVWIYVLLGTVAIVYFRKLVIAWKEWQGTVFGLERESAQRRFSTSLTILVLLVLFVVVEFVIVSFVAPNRPQLAALPTPTLDLLATPTITVLPVMGAVRSEDTTAVAPTAIATIAAVQQGCIAGQIEWTYPQAGDTISATIELKGTVNVPNLGYYKYEYARPGEEIWKPIAAGNQPKMDGQIGFWNTSALDQGDYLLRLVVADNQDNLFPPCQIPVRVVTQ